ncbi:hypothetical protein KQX54_009775 [Cotesia glomerata]|uniref:Hexosyltransferase n=1 Tax=Cotesia glomerata TaxID=32391 RepID=A0AAV7IUP3_COTGL|nr:hypothetical protein KQX54_009775 [Cotesia glomerata]
MSIVRSNIILISTPRYHWNWNLRRLIVGTDASPRALPSCYGASGPKVRELNEDKVVLFISGLMYPHGYSREKIRYVSWVNVALTSKYLLGSTFPYQ